MNNNTEKVTILKIDKFKCTVAIGNAQDYNIERHNCKAISITMNPQ